MNGSQALRRPASSNFKSDEYVEPYALHRSNEAKLAAHVEAMYLKAADIIRSSIDEPFTDVSAMLQNKDHIKNAISKQTVKMPQCANAAKFYTSLGRQDPDAFHQRLAEATHATLTKAWNAYSTKDGLHTGGDFIRYAKKHSAEFHNNKRFSDQVKNKDVAAAQQGEPIGRPTLLPPIRMPPSQKTGKIDSDMPALRPYDDEQDEDAMDMIEGPFSKYKEWRMERAEKNLAQAKAKLAKAKLEMEDAGGDRKKQIKAQQKIDEAEAEVRRYERATERRGDKLGDEIDNEVVDFDDMPALSQPASASIDSAMPPLVNKSQKLSKKFEDYSDEEFSDDADYAAMPSLKSQGQQQKLFSDDDDMADSFDDDMPALRPLGSSAPAANAGLKKEQSDNTEDLTAVQWLRQCAITHDPKQKISLKPGTVYVFFAPTNNKIRGVEQWFAANSEKVLSKKQLVMQHLAEKSQTQEFKTMSGRSVVKQGTAIKTPMVENPELVGIAAGRVPTINVGGAKVLVLVHNNVFK